MGNTYRGIVATSDGKLRERGQLELWELCLDYPNYPSSQIANERLFVSEDGGTSWTLRTTTQVSGQQVQDGWALDVNRNIWVTTDGGDHWRQAGS